MTKSANARNMLLMTAVIVGFGLAGMGCSPTIPFAFDISINLGTYDLSALQVYAGLFAGAEIPEDFEAPALPVCNLPTQEEIRELVSEAAGDWVANLIHLKAMNLVATELTAISGDFDDLTYLSLQWQPKPLGGVAQPSVNLGTADSALGLGTQILLGPPVPVDFLALIEDDAANPATECASLGIDVDGVVPSTVPVMAVTVTLNVVGEVRLR
ncbi:MAG: hypothetical protein GWP08_00255 [Nitrospiraceae bacterium]|nr:hypothetical protein [Nitrospiraceae bacterium]